MSAFVIAKNLLKLLGGGRRRSAILFPFLLLMACGGIQVAEPVGTVPVDTATAMTPATATATRQPALPTAEQLPSNTPTLEPTITATSQPEPTVTDVPTTATPSPTPCAQPGQIEHEVVETAVAGPFAYRVYLPPCYGMDDIIYPTLYLLPGNIHDESIWDQLGIDEAADAAVHAGTIQPLIIVMPDGGWIANETSGGPKSYEELLLTELIPEIERNYCTWADSNGRAIGGLSRGGYWSLEIAFRQPELFRSVGGHSFALVDSHAGADKDPVQTGANNDLGDLRIYLDIGRNDPYLVQARPLHDALTAAGVEHVWQLNEGGHENAYWESHLLDYLGWYDQGWVLPNENSPDCTITQD